MQPNEAKALIGAITSTLFELGNPVSPASSVYMALGMNLERYETIAHVLSELGLAKVTASTIQLTESGMDLGRKCQSIYDEAKTA